MKFLTKLFAKPSLPFQAGDKVEAFGNIGTVKSVGKNGYLEVTFAEAPGVMVFLQDGRLMSWHKIAVLKKIK